LISGALPGHSVSSLFDKLTYKCYGKGCMKSAVFFERDGVINAYTQGTEPHRSPESVEAFTLCKGIASLMKTLKDAGLLVFVTTHQPGLAQGSLDRRELERMHLVMKAKLPIDDVLICPHEPSDPCPCAKPRTGLFKELEHQYRLDMDHSFVVSDKWQDAAAAHTLGCISVMLQSPLLGKVQRDYTLESLEAIGEKIAYLHANQSELMLA
jgi:D-glycero-D-manno-heptose 1,7-bisphosphate phosphatase